MSFAPVVLAEPGSFLMDDRPGGRRGGTTYLLTRPMRIITAAGRADVPRALAELDAALASGQFAAGYLAYDAGFGLDFPRQPRHEPPLPLVWLGVYDACQTFEADAIGLPTGGPLQLDDLRLDVSQTQYEQAVERCRQYIAAGDVYQVNYTCKYRFEHGRPPHELFAYLRQAHPVDHAAFLNAGEFQVISLSPELFLRRQGDEVLTRPMKGTLRRGRWCEEDERLAAALPADEKNRAENVMIVDLMRNDLGRVCRFGSIAVRRPLWVERYRSLLQMTSDVVGRLRPGVTSGDLLRAVFPPGSVTGAPKIRAMEIIDELEREARGVYCGVMGLFRPGGDCLLNVAIRTIVQRGRQCEMGVGSGIVADSNPAAEWNEIRLKARFLTDDPGEFELLETIRVAPGEPPVWAEAHLARMWRSADYFGWPFPEAALRRLLDEKAAEATELSRLRLLLAESGDCRAELSPLSESGDPRIGRLILAARRTDPDDRLLYHKTTARADYDADWREARDRGFFDLVYCNTRDEITEGAISSLIFEIDGRWVTPALESGLLPGLWRARQLAAGVSESTIRLDDLRRATRIVVGNSVRGTTPIVEILAADGQEPVWRQPAQG